MKLYELKKDQVKAELKRMQKIEDIIYFREIETGKLIKEYIYLYYKNKEEPELAEKKKYFEHLKKNN